MKVHVSELYAPETQCWRICFKAQPDQADIEYNNKIRGKLNRREVDIDLVGDARLDTIHPDLIGLTALLLVAPFSRRTLSINLPMSDGFVKTVRKHLLHFEAPANNALSRRQTPQDARPGLAFSGGVDSCAALTLMPKHTVPVFLHRRQPPGSASGGYDPSAALASCAAARDHGYDVQKIQTSMEYIRKPVGNPIHWSNSAPAIVNADTLGLNSISFGLIAESAYWTGGPYFSDLKTRDSYSKWAPIFEYCNIPLSFPTAALSEVLTSKICMKADVDFLPQSCVRGEPGKPCQNCFKCFRKGLVEAALEDRHLPSVLVSNTTKGSEVAKKLLEKPIHHEIVMAWAVAALRKTSNTEQAVIDALEHKLGSVSDYGQNLDFLDKYYPPGLEYTASDIRTGVERKIQKFCLPMSAANQEYFMAWSADTFQTAGSYEAGQQELEALLDPQESAR